MSNCNVNQLSSDAACFTCLDSKIRDGIQTELLCQILTAIGEGGSSCVTQCTTPWIIEGNVNASGSVVALDAGTLAALETVTVFQGTSPWVVGGTIAISNFPASQPVTITMGATSNLTNVAASASSVQLLASNASRIKAVIFNDSVSATLYIKEGTTASVNSFTWKCFQGQTVVIDDYYGRIDGIWSAVVGNARVTETIP